MKAARCILLRDEAVAPTGLGFLQGEALLLEVLVGAVAPPRGEPENTSGLLLLLVVVQQRDAQLQRCVGDHINRRAVSTGHPVQGDMDDTA